MVQKFKILTHITSSDHLPQSIEVNAVLFEDSVQTMPREKVLEEHSQCCGEHTKDALELLEELDVAPSMSKIVARVPRRAKQ